MCTQSQMTAEFMVLEYTPFVNMEVGGATTKGQFIKYWHNYCV